ncbi:MAG: hypothetical protein M5R36_25700 [Deltaproteobacteria bacterium]|nr:hypothetical protein [Deltaproteobacteria bacterium]
MKTLLAAATTLALLVAFAGCTSSGNDAPGARQGVGSTAPNDEQDDDGGGDSQRCLEAFNDLSARCGAQFVDSDGAVIPLNDLLGGVWRAGRGMHCLVRRSGRRLRRHPRVSLRSL